MARLITLSGAAVTPYGNRDCLCTFYDRQPTVISTLRGHFLQDEEPDQSISEACPIHGRRMRHHA